MCFHTTNDSSIQGLDIRSEIWLEVDELDIGRLVGDQMAWKVVKCQSNMPVLAPELLIKLFDPLFKEFGGHPSCFVVAVSMPPNSRPSLRPDRTLVHIFAEY